MMARVIAVAAKWAGAVAVFVAWWPVRVLSGVVSWWLERHVPKERGFGPFVNKFEKKMTPTEEQLAHARAFIADAERTENSMGTRIDAAINAIAVLDLRALENDAIHKYLHLKYATTDTDLTFYYDTALRHAKTLLSNLETR